MEAVAKLRNCPLSARKMRLVADLVRGKKVEDAVNILKFTNKEAAGWLEKLVLSAVTNWEKENQWCSGRRSTRSVYQNAHGG